MSDNVWLRCDHCNKELRETSDQVMQLAVRFKPSLFRRSLDQLHPQERRHRCRACGWVNVFVPSASVAAEQPNSLLTPSWRHISLKS
jgi:hypothetical protein